MNKQELKSKLELWSNMCNAEFGGEPPPDVSENVTPQYRFWAQALLANVGEFEVIEEIVGSTAESDLRQAKKLARSGEPHLVRQVYDLIQEVRAQIDDLNS